MDKLEKKHNFEAEHFRAKTIALYMGMGAALPPIIIGAWELGKYFLK